MVSVRWVGVFLVAACGGAKTPEEAARAYADAYNRRDGGAVYDMLSLAERKTWDAESPTLTGPGSRRDRFAQFIVGVWGTDRGTATIVGVRTEGDRATATMDVVKEQLQLTFVREDGAWRVSFMPERR